MLATMLIQYSPGSHNLETVAKTYLDITIDKSLRMSDWSASELSHDQLTYAARDSQVLIPLRQTLIKLLAKDNLFRVAQLEFEACRHLLQSNWQVFIWIATYGNNSSTP